MDVDCGGKGKGRRLSSNLLFQYTVVINTGEYEEIDDELGGRRRS